MFGRDVFIFFLTKTGVFPEGCGYNTAYYQNRCNVGDGDGCAAKVLKEGAINY
jgi:hypothetical protein